MDSPAAPALPRPSSRWVRREMAVLLVAFLAYAVIAATHLGVYAGGSDSSGYMNNVRLLREGRMHVPQRAIEGLPPAAMPYFAYVPLGFMPLSSGEMVPTYPVGLSLLIAGMSCVTGWESGPWVTVWLNSVLGVLVIYAWGRLLHLSRIASGFGALLLAACPLYLFNSLQALSDSPALVWTAAAVYFAWRSRERAGWSILAGFLVAIAVLVRPTNILVLLPVAVCLGFSSRHWMGLILGGLPGALFLLIYNVRLYGRIVTTGYGDVSESFNRSFVAPALANYAQWLPILLTPAVVLVLALPFLFRRVGARLTLMLLGWIVGFAGFYAYYYFTAETWWALRFILPAFPALILGTLAAARAISASWSPHVRNVIVGVAVVAVLIWDSRWIARQSALEAAEGERAFVQATQWAQTHLPARAVVVCMQTSGAFLYYTDHILLRYDFAGTAAEVKRTLQACAAAGRPVYAALYAFELGTALEERMPGRWTQVGTTRNVTFWRRDGDEPTPIEKSPWRELVSGRVGDAEVIVSTGPGWFGAEEYRGRRWTWSSGPAHLKIETSPAMNGTLQLDFLLRSLVSANATISQHGSRLWEGPVGPDRRPHTLAVTVHHGVAELEFTSDAPATPENSAPDARRLAIGLYDLRVSPAPTK